MRKVPFKSSSIMSIGVELELQIIDPRTWDLVNRSKDLLKAVAKSDFKKLIKPEVTQSMIEINTSVHKDLDTLSVELYKMQKFLLEVADDLDVKVSGGGTHPFQQWSSQRIFPAKRYKALAKEYRYLSKRATVFGQHVHVGCQSGDDAVYLTHALAAYVPHFLALSASSPFYQGSDSGFHSARSTSTMFNALPMSGVIPYFVNWEEFCEYFLLMKRAKIINSMKDCYWDIRPKPEFGTVEIRICDTPLSLKKSLMLAAYIQILAHFHLTNRNFHYPKDLYHLYNYNRFQASRYGFDGGFVVASSLQHISIKKSILDTIKIIEPSAQALGLTKYLDMVKINAERRLNDARALRDLFHKEKSLKKIVRRQCKIWAKK